MSIPNSLHHQILEPIIRSETYGEVPTMSLLCKGKLPTEYLLSLETRLDDLLTFSSLPFSRVQLRTKPIGIQLATVHGSSSNGEDSSRGDLAAASALAESSMESNSSNLEDLDEEDLRQLVVLLGILSTIEYAPNPKRINLFTIGSVVTYKHLHQYLIDIIYTLCHDAAPPSKEMLGKLLFIIQAYLFMLITPGSPGHNLISEFAINWILSLLREVLGTLSPESTLEISCLQQNLKTNLILLVKAVLDHLVLHGLVTNLVNFLGVWSAADPFGAELPLASCSYNCMALVLESSYFSFRDLFPHMLKWICFNMRKPAESNLATAFLCRNLTYMASEGCLDFLMHLFKNITSDSVDKEVTKAKLASNLSKVLASLDYSEAFHIFEIFLKDCIQASSAPTRAFTIDIFEVWFGMVLHPRSDLPTLKTNNYTTLELLNLLVALMDLIAGRFLDRTQVVRSRALTAYMAVITKIKTHRQKSRTDVVAQLMEKLSKQCNERFVSTLTRCCSDHKHFIRQTAIQVFTFFLNLHLSTSEPPEAFMTSILSSYIQQFQDPNWRVRKACVASVAQSLRIAFSAAALPNVFGALWHLWIEYALPTMFDPEKEVKELALQATAEFLPNLYRIPSVLAQPFPELSLKGLRQVFFLLSERAAFQRNLPTEPKGVHSLSNLLECPHFLDFLLSGEDVGHWQLAAAASAHAKPRPDMMAKVALRLEKAMDQCGSTTEPSAPDDWVVIGVSVLTVVNNWTEIYLPTDILFKLGEYLAKLEAPVQWIYPMLRLLQTWPTNYWPAPPGEKVNSFDSFVDALLGFCCRICQQVANELDKSDDFLLENSLLKTVSTAAFAIGELCMISPTCPADGAFKVLLALIGQVRRNTDSFLFPHAARALAYISAGKLALIHEPIAKKLIPAIASELDLQLLVTKRAPEIPLCEVFTLETQDDTRVQHSALVVFADLCLQHTSATDNYLPLVANCLRHPNAAMRQKAFLMFTRLLRNDFIKWRGHLAFKFIVALVTEADALVREFAYYCFVHVLLVKTPSLLLDKLIGLVLFINGDHPPKNALHLPPTEEESLLFTFPGCHEVRRRFRHRCYKFVLEHLTPEQRFRATYIICRQLLAPAADGSINVKSILGQNVLEDALHILGSKEIQIPIPLSRPEEFDTQAQQRTKLLSSINIHNAILNIIPTILQLKSTLERHHSPLQGVLMECFGRIISHYRIDTDSLLATVDAKHLEELRYDLTRLRQEATNKRQRIDSKLELDHSQVGLLTNSPTSATEPEEAQTNSISSHSPTPPFSSNYDMLTSTPLFTRKGLLPVCPTPQPKPRRNPRRATQWTPGRVTAGLENLDDGISSYLVDVGSPILSNSRASASPVFATLDDFEIPPHPSPAIQLSRRAWANLPGNSQPGLRPDEIDPEALLNCLPSPAYPRKRFL